MLADALVRLTGELGDVSVDRLGEFEHGFCAAFAADAFAIVRSRSVVSPELCQLFLELSIVESGVVAAFVDGFVIDVLVCVEEAVVQEIELERSLDRSERNLDDDCVVPVLRDEVTGGLDQAARFSELEEVCIVDVEPSLHALGATLE